MKRHHKTTSFNRVLGRFDVESVLMHTDIAATKRLYVINNKEYWVNMDSQRYGVFKKSIRCKSCGLEANEMRLERFGTDLDHPHFNLYFVDRDDKVVLFTKDHIVPRSRGGRDILANYQTMCLPCNEKKADNYEQ